MSQLNKVFLMLSLVYLVTDQDVTKKTQLDKTCVPPQSPLMINVYYIIMMLKSLILCFWFGSLYQIFVLPVEGIMMFDCSSPASLDTSKSAAEYITAQLHVQNVGTEMNFTVGDGFLYGGFYNAPLESGRTYYVILRAVSQWNMVSQDYSLLYCEQLWYTLEIAELFLNVFSSRPQEAAVSCGRR